MLHKAAIALLARFSSERGQSLTEYSLILVFVAVALVAVLTTFALALSGNLDDASAVFP